MLFDIPNRAHIAYDKLTKVESPQATIMFGDAACTMATNPQTPGYMRCNYYLGTKQVYPPGVANADWLDARHGNEASANVSRYDGGVSSVNSGNISNYWLHYKYY